MVVVVRTIVVGHHQDNYRGNYRRGQGRSPRRIYPISTGYDDFITFRTQFSPKKQAFLCDSQADISVIRAQFVPQGRAIN